MDSGINIRKVNDYLDITDYLYKLPNLCTSSIKKSNTF